MSGWTRGESAEERYAREHGEAALARQREASSSRCSACWAPTGEPHSAGCPNLPEDDDPPTQEEALF